LASLKWRGKIISSGKLDCWQKFTKANPRPVFWDYWEWGEGKEGFFVPKTETKTIAQNKKAFHDYFVEESYEAGIELAGTEVKSLRQGKVNLKDAWCSVVEGELVLNGCHISPYEQGNIFNRDPMRVRRLLMHKREIMRLLGYVKQEGYALIPLSLYFKGSRVKVQVGLCRGKKLYDKRADLAERSAKRDIQRAIKNQNK
jgi:SsrA-binding protein